MRSSFIAVWPLLIFTLFEFSIYAQTEKPTEEPVKEHAAQPLYFFCEDHKNCPIPLAAPYLLFRATTFPFDAVNEAIQKNKVTRRAYDVFTGTPKDFSIYPKIWLGDGNHFGGGFGLTALNLLEKSYQLQMEYLLFTNLGMRAKLVFGNPHAFWAWKRAFSFWVPSEFRREFEQNFFGLGNDSQSDNEATYARDRVETGFSVGFEVIPKLVFSTGLFFNFNQSGTGKGDLSVEEVFPSDEIPGFGEDINYFDWRFRLSHDTRDRFILSEKGGRYRATYDLLPDLNGSGHGFSKLDFEFEHYIPIGRPRYVLWLHNRWVFLNSLGGDEIPFYHLALLDYDRGLRSFPSGRFRDNGSIVFNVEQRFPLWKTVDGAVFFDTGRVYPGIENFSLNDLKYSAGFGVRVLVGKHFCGIIDGAYGNDGFKVTANIRNVFDLLQY